MFLNKTVKYDFYKAVFI